MDTPTREGFETVYEVKPDIFEQDTLRASREVICCPTHGRDTEERFEKETPILVDALGNFISDGDTILDYGAGIGRISIPIALHYTDSRIWAADSSKSMRTFGREEAQSAGVKDRVSFILGAPLTEVETDSVDFAFSIYVLQHIPENPLEEALTEIRRVLKPDGALYTLNYKKRAAIDVTVPKGVNPWKEDRFDQYGALERIFGKPREVKLTADFIQPDLTDHFSLVFGNTERTKPR